MSDDVLIRIKGCAGRITLNRPEALNALTYAMCLKIEAALDAWARDEAVSLLVIDGAPGRAFCSGGDIIEMYRTGMAGDFDYGRRFWRDEYRMNRKMFHFPKPVVTFLHGFTMGGGVGVGCHGSHRIVGETSRIAMPECGIGLIPDVGGSLLLARAPGRLGEYLGITADRMAGGDAIHAGFADYFVPEAAWPDLIERLETNIDLDAIEAASHPASENQMAARQEEIDSLFGGETLRDIVNALRHDGGEMAMASATMIERNSPLSMSCTIELIHRVRNRDTIEDALEAEYRYTHRSMEHGDFLEGIRAMIVDKDRTPKWRHESPVDVAQADVSRMLAPLGNKALEFGETT